MLAKQQLIYQRKVLAKLVGDTLVVDTSLFPTVASDARTQLAQEATAAFAVLLERWKVEVRARDGVVAMQS